MRKQVVGVKLIFIVSALIFSLNLVNIWLQYSNQTPDHPAAYTDYFALWSYPTIAHLYSVADVYDLSTLHNHQVVLGMAPASEMPFAYPPTALLMTWPLTILPYDVGFVVLVGGAFALFVGTVWATCSRMPLCILGVIIAPATTANIYSGQTGFLSAALLISGVLFAKTRPVIAGICIGLLSFKPQLGCLVPIAFIAAGLWGAFSVACVTVVVMAVVTTFIFGLGVWATWISMLPSYTAWWDSKPQLFSPTVRDTLLMANCPAGIATGVQLVVAVVVVILIWRCFGRDPGRPAAAALMVGTFLVTPHALHYDMSTVTVAMVLFITDRIKSGVMINSAEIGILSLVMLLPMLMFINILFLLPFAVFPLIFLFGIIVQDCLDQPVALLRGSARGLLEPRSN